MEGEVKSFDFLFCFWIFSLFFPFLIFPVPFFSFFFLVMMMKTLERKEETQRGCFFFFIGIGF